MTFAIVETGGKQVRVSPGDELFVEKLPGEPGTEVPLTRVLLIKDAEKTMFGRPYLKDTRVIARILEVVRGEKIRVFHKRRRKRYKKMQGHRQWLTRIRIERLESGHGA